VAESVTAGHLQAALSVAIDASKFFQGGITAYNLGQKARHLHVDPIIAESTNCVDRAVAETMAIEVANLFSANYGLSITGYASKVPESDDDLYAFFCVVHDGEVLLLDRITAAEKHPHEVQVDYPNRVLKRLYEAITMRE